MRGPDPLAKDTGLRNLPLHGFAQNQIWCELVAMACELLAWMAMLALDGPAGHGNPNAYGCACSPPLAASSVAAAGCGAPRRDLALGHPDHRRDHPLQAFAPG